ncbi:MULTISPECIES: hypothetical protein [Bacillus]|uniref:hypothetical protein n=1 Tax=Bacillus TaxID=1386 RepID=UPI00159641C6|nr:MULTISPECIES: hypothetical protein [Bacillus]
MEVGDDMKLLNISYKKRGRIVGYFDKFPNSPVLFAPIKDYHFTYRVNWDSQDPIVEKVDLVKMELLLNQYLEQEHEYITRESQKQIRQNSGGACNYFVTK